MKAVKKIGYFVKTGHKVVRTCDAEVDLINYRTGLRFENLETINNCLCARIVKKWE